VWNTGEPNNHPFGGLKHGEQCVEIISRPAKDGSSEQIGKLNDIPCIKPTLGVLCQIDGSFVPLLYINRIFVINV